jgi:acyl-CoA thioesterase-1
MLARAIIGWAAATVIAYSPANAAELRLMALGDSLVAGFGLAEGKGFAPLLERALNARGLSVKVLNAGVSGDTTAGGLGRLDWALADKPTAAIVELGANDMLRGLDPAEARKNLDAILAKLKERGVKVLLAGMLAAPNLGKDYAGEFDAIYPDLAKKHGVPLYPFFLEGVAGQAALLLPDGMHPNERGVEEIVARIAPFVAKLLLESGKAP